MITCMEMKRNARNPFADQSVHDSSSSSESEELHRPEKKLRLKVKIPAKPNEEQNTNPSPPPRRRHFCEVCNKEFSSGKAFGGHVRIHSIEYKSKNKSKMMKKNKNSTVKKKKKNKEKNMKRIEKEERDLMGRADVEEGGEISCCICGKVFLTKHSLFGHMRRHPDRSWKGIRPPPPPLPESEFELRMMSVAAGSSSSSKKFKISSCTSDLDDDYDDVLDVTSTSMTDVQEAAYCLMMLSCARINYRPVKSLGFGLESSSGDMGKAKPGVRNPCPREETRHGYQMGSSKGKGVVVDMKMKIGSGDRFHVRAREEKVLGFDLNQPYVGGEDGGDDWFQI
ncbi:PREDICTED: zinc finger protein AZF1 [Tarenaya hassleriana]|uniref:zinc finger protein AZF1 n=1 Tax=Tarenaya hassleriana TaxID=28532 RepID=UPI00053C934C|nr:PREDICTED: zinc finger protein AZF1 [Tarenaya hassleriana]